MSNPQLLFLIIIKYLINKMKRNNSFKTESNDVVFLIAERFNMLQNFFNCSYRGAVSLPTRMIEFCFWLRRSADAQYLLLNFMIRSTEAVVRRCSWKQVFLTIS